MASEGLVVDQADPISRIMNRIEQAQRRAEAGRLPVDEWDSLLDEETAIERALLEHLDNLVAVADMGGGSKIWAVIAELNERLSAIADVIIKSSEDLPVDDELAEQRTSCATFGALARAQSAGMAAAGHRITGNLAEAEARATEAKQRFELLARDENSEDFESISVVTHVIEGLRLGIIATAKLLRFQHQDASITFLQAQKSVEKARTLAIQSKKTTAAEWSSILTDIYEYKTAAERALLLKAIIDSDFEKAAACASALVAIAAPPDDGILPAWIAQTPKLNRGVAACYLAYAKAELAVNSRNWEEAERHLADCENQWREQIAIAIDLDVPQGRQIAESFQAISAQIVGGTRRRIERERALCAQIAELQVENQQLQDQIYQMAKEPRFGVGVSGDTYNFRDVKGGQVGRNNRQIIENSFNEFSAAHAKKDDLADQMRTLKDNIADLVTGLHSQGDASAGTEVAETFQAFAEEVAKKEPRSGTLRALGKALIESAGRVAKVAAPVAGAVATVMTIFGLPPV
jgi:hypothetical protein